VVAVLAVLAALPSAALAQPGTVVYASANGGAEVLGYQADGAGLLAPLPAPSVAAGTKPAGVALSPDGASLYVANQLDATLSQYDVAADGALVPKATPEVATGPSPLGVAIAPDGRHLYVANQGDGTVSVFDVGAGGALAAASTATAGPGAASVAIAPDGRHAYVTDFTSAQVSQFAVDADGSLSALSPARVAAGSAPFDVEVSGDGASVYVTDQSVAGSVLQYDAGAGGALSPKAPAAVDAGRLPTGLAVGPGGVYVANFGSGTISQYDVGAGGALSAKAAPDAPTALNPWGLALAPDGASLYAANYGGASISQYDVDATGALAPKAAAPEVASGARPVELAVGRLRDATAPTVDLRTPPEGAQYTAGDVVVADYACADEGGSGLVACTGTVPAGAALDTDEPGDFAFTVTARDGEGHETTVTHHYTVAPAPLDWRGFRRPLRPPPVVNVRDAGDDVDIRFSLGGFVGLDVLAPGAPSYARVDCDHPEDQIGDTRAAVSALRRPRVRYLGGGVYRFVWDTKAIWTGTCRRFTLTLADGSTHDLLFHLRAPRSSSSARAYAARVRHRSRR
jgi:DNA-binding beta-propeller fold protein YncE